MKCTPYLQTANVCLPSAVKLLIQTGNVCPSPQVNRKLLFSPPAQPKPAAVKLLLASSSKSCRNAALIPQFAVKLRCLSPPPPPQPKQGRHHLREDHHCRQCTAQKHDPQHHRRHCLEDLYYHQQHHEDRHVATAKNRILVIDVKELNCDLIVSSRCRSCNREDCWQSYRS